MLDFKKILIPYDGSSHAKKALNQAISLAQCSDGAELYVATILNSTIPADDDPDQVDMAEVEKLIPENIPHKVLLEMEAQEELRILEEKGIGIVAKNSR